MADKRGLEIVGVAFGLVTATVVMIAAMVVKLHVDHEAPIEKSPVVAALIAPILR
jgi:hypothetical protein